MASYVHSEIPQVFEQACGIACLDYSELSGGRTNTSFLITSPIGRHVLRVPGIGTNEYINRSFEHDNLEVMKSLGFIPEIDYNDKESGILITRYVENAQPMSVADLEDQRRCDAIVERLVRIHKSELVMPNRFNIVENKNHYTEILSNLGAELPFELSREASLLEECMKVIESDYSSDFVPCHGDPKLDNFLLTDEGMWVIDWEYSGMNDKYFDLVNLPMTNSLSLQQEKVFLHTYERLSGETVNPKKYLLFKVATDYLWIYWHLIKLFEGQMVEYNERSWRNRLNRALANIDELKRLGL